MNVKRSTVEEGALNEPSTDSEIPKLYLKALTKIQIDTFVITHGPFTSVIGMYWMIMNPSELNFC